MVVRILPLGSARQISDRPHLIGRQVTHRKLDGRGEKSCLTLRHHIGPLPGLESSLLPIVRLPTGPCPLPFPFPAEPTGALVGIINGGASAYSNLIGSCVGTAYPHSRVCRFPPTFELLEAENFSITNFIRALLRFFRLPRVSNTLMTASMLGNSSSIGVKSLSTWAIRGVEPVLRPPPFEKPSVPSARLAPAGRCREWGQGRTILATAGERNLEFPRHTLVQRITQQMIGHRLRIRRHIEYLSLANPAR